MAGKKDGPRPGWVGLSPERVAELEARRERFAQLRGEARQLAKLEGFLEANQRAAADFFATKLEFIHAMIDGVRDENGAISTGKVAAMLPADKKILLDAFEKVERSAGFQQKTTTHKHEHTIGLAEQFKQLQAGDQGDVIEAEVVGVEHE